MWSSVSEGSLVGCRPSLSGGRGLAELLSADRGSSHQDMEWSWRASGDYLQAPWPGTTGPWLVQTWGEWDWRTSDWTLTCTYICEVSEIGGPQTGPWFVQRWGKWDCRTSGYVMHPDLLWDLGFEVSGYRGPQEPWYWTSAGTEVRWEVSEDLMVMSCTLHALSTLVVRLVILWDLMGFWMTRRIF